MQKHLDIRRFNYLAAETDAAYHEMIAKLGLTDSAALILYAVCDYDAEGFRCPLREILRRIWASKQTVNSALRKLEKQGILYLIPESARTKTVCLTEKGAGLARRTVMRMIAAEDEILRAWPQEDAEKYFTLTERYLAAFREKTEAMEPSAGEDFRL